MPIQRFEAGAIPMPNETAPVPRLADATSSRDHTNLLVRPGLVPELDVFDLERSLEFWCGGLGFTKAYDRPEAGFAYLERDGIHVMLNRINGNWSVGPLEPPLGRGLNLQITVAALAPVLAGLAALDWPLFRNVHDAWYRAGGIEVGLRQMLVQDPDGYLVRFCEALGTRPLSPAGPAS